MTDLTCSSTKSTSTSRRATAGTAPWLPPRKVRPARRPEGGDGGHGGSDLHRRHRPPNTLINYRFHQLFDAERGEHGEGSNRTGHNGADIELAVPIGTVVHERIPTSQPRLAIRLERSEPTDPAMRGESGEPAGMSSSRI